MIEVGSGPWLTLILGAGGALLLVLRPAWAAILVVFVFSAEDVRSLALSQFPGTTYVFNALDVGVIVLLCGALIVGVRGERDDRPIGLPTPAAAVLFIVAISGGVGLLRFGFTHETGQAIRWALTFPLVFSAIAVYSRSQRTRRGLLLAVLSGGFVSSLLVIVEYGIRVRTEMLPAHEITLAALRVPQLTLAAPLLMVVVLLSRERIVPSRPLVVIVVGVVLMSIFLTQTRSLWVGCALSLLGTYLWIRRIVSIKNPLQNRGIEIATIALISTGMIYWMLNNLPHSLNVSDIIHERFSKLADATSPASAAPRLEAAKWELSQWLSGNMVVGNGLAYFQSVADEMPGLRHVGYATYLAQTGIMGFLVYAVYVPISVLRRSHASFQYRAHKCDGVVGVMGIACFLFVIFTSAVSGSLLFHAQVPAIVAGLVWGIK